MGVRISSWFASVGSTAKAIIALIALIALIISATLAVAQQLDLPDRVTATENAIDSLRVRDAMNELHIQQIGEDTKTILCIITLPTSIPPAESRLRCP